MGRRNAEPTRIKEKTMGIEEFKMATEAPIRMLGVVRELNKRDNNIPYEESDKAAAEVMREIFHEYEIMSDMELSIKSDMLVRTLERSL